MEAATLAARAERTFDSEVEVSADLDSLAATEVARALLSNIQDLENANTKKSRNASRNAISCILNRPVKISAEVSTELDLLTATKISKD